MEGVERQPHIALTKEQQRPVVLVVGDPARTQLIASLCDESRPLAFNREYRSFDCCSKGQWFTVMSHGVGSAGAAICFEELIQNGAKIIIRAGTCGSLQVEKHHQGDVLICNAAVREDGVSALIVPQGYPAVADPYVLQVMERIVKDTGKPIKRGITLSSDLFYKSPVLPSSLELYAKAGVDVVEMEVSTLFVLASIRGIKAGAICCIDGSPFKWSEADGYAPAGNHVEEGKKLMCLAAIEACAQMAKEANWE